MKYFLSCVISVLFIFGCTENQPISSPEFESEFGKSNSLNNSNYVDEEQTATYLDQEPDWICLPIANSPAQSPTFFTSKWISNNQSTNLFIDTSYSGGLFDNVNFHLKLTFSPGALSQDSMLVTAEVDIHNGTIKFGPPTVFNEPIYLNYKITGLDFSVMDPNEIRFIYAGDDGIIEPINCWYYEIKENVGSIQMWWGEIPHFSRFGFIKRGGEY